MAITIATAAGDLLDELVALHYGVGSADAGFSAVLAANPGLAALGPAPPAGTRIVMPDLQPPGSGVLELWD